MTEEEVQEMRDMFIKRIERLEKALSELWPAWEYGGCMPDCSAACCET